MKAKKTVNIAIIALAFLFVLSCMFTAGKAVNVYTDVNRTSVSLAQNLASGQGQSGTVSLYRGNAMDGERFAVDGMLPGDSFSYTYDVDVSFRNSVMMSMKINVRDGYEKLAEVLKFKVENLTDDATLYDGTAKDLPAKWDKVLSTAAAEGETVRTTYAITAYLDKSVGNDYQNLSLVADFTWEVADYEPGNQGGDEGSNEGGNEGGNENDNLIPSSPATGENALKILIITSTALGLLLIIMIMVRKILVKDQESKSLKRFRRSVTGIVILFGVLCTTTIAYAYYVAKTVENNEFTTGVVAISLSNESTAVGGGDILLEPGATSEKVFKLTNDSTCEVYYKLYFSNIEGELADVLEITVLSEDEEIFAGIMSEMTRESAAAADEALGIGEEKELKVLFHMPEECGNEAQAQSITFDMNVDAVQSVNNPDKAFE